MVFDSRLTIRSVLVALLLSNLVAAEPLPAYSRHHHAAVEASERGRASGPGSPPGSPPGVAPGSPPAPVPSGSSIGSSMPANMSSPSAGYNTSSSSQPDSSAQSQAAPADSGALLLCGSQYYSQDKV